MRLVLVGLTHVDFGLDNAKGLSPVAEDKVLLARGASWSDKEVFLFFFLLLWSEVGVGGASGMEFEVVQCMKKFLWKFCLGVVVMLNLVLLVSVKYTSTMVESGVAIGVLWLVTSSEILFYNLI